jgi:hypothetical protein
MTDAIETNKVFALTISNHFLMFFNIILIPNLIDVSM